MCLKKISKYICILCITIFSFSCTNITEASKIEIYTFKEQNEVVNDVYYSVKKEIIYAPKFEAVQNSISKNPLILNEEILCVDTALGKIRLSAEAINKIVTIKPSMKHGLKFVICKDKKPLITGYFWSSLSSYGSTWNCIEYNHTEKVKHPTDLNMYKGNGINALNREKINFNDYAELIQSLGRSGKLDCSIKEKK